ncbi:MAG TPA: PDZ domain-containing protein [bacterium]|nr:PDZ domain-containing protein [bacterium]
MVRGMVEGLGDKHTVYFDPKETQSFHESLDGEFEGIGAYVGKNDLGVEVTKVMEGSPALQGDIRAGDVIIKADDTELSGMTVQEAIEYIR